MVDQLATIEHSPVKHHIHDGKWIARPSKPHPVVMTQLTPMPKEHGKLGHAIPKTKLKPLVVPMIADSGCQSSIIPFNTAMAMGYKRGDILPVTLSMRGAIHEDLGVEGAIIAQVGVNDNCGLQRTCLQFIYISKKMEKAFLCREALEQLGIISKDFPEIVPPQTIDQSMSLSVEPPSEALCDCPRRTHTMPPFPPHYQMA